MITRTRLSLYALKNGHIKEHKTNFEYMKTGQVEKAERIALNQFDKWNDVTGFVQEHTGYYYEVQSLIKEAVHIGIQMSINGKVEFGADGNVKTP